LPPAAVGTTIFLSDMLIKFLNGIICGFGIIISAFFGADDEKGLKKAIREHRSFPVL
jgi:Na+-driven multidrug efflux pump